MVISGDAHIAAVASVLAEPARVAMLLALSDGRALPAGELAQQARVSPSTASAHLTKLIEAGLLKVEKQGRWRYFRITDPAVVESLEALSMIAPPAPVHSLHEATIGDAVRRARMCYNHLAGNLGVNLAQALMSKKFLVLADGGYLVTDDGKQWFYDFGVDCSTMKRLEPAFVPYHIDWSERRPHLAGKLGAALTKHLMELGWVKRLPSSRAVQVTEEGQMSLLRELDICL
jgi:DNA-binding transcriptional ArsR family regulator